MMAIDLGDYAGKVTVADGAWGTQLDLRGCPPGYCREEWNISNPDAVREVAAAYVDAGAQIVLTNTFSGNAVALTTHGFEPSRRVSFGMMMLTGIFVPSLEVANSRTTFVSLKFTGDSDASAVWTVLPVLGLKWYRADGSTKELLANSRSSPFSPGS